jgi:hypothetical protein
MNSKIFSQLFNNKTIVPINFIIVFVLLYQFSGLAQQQTAPTSFKGSAVAYKTLATTLGELTVPEKTTVSFDNGSSVKLQINLKDNNTFGIDINKYYTTPGNPLDNNTARQTATAYGTYTVLKENCPHEGECFFELENPSSKIKYFARSTRGNATGDFYFMVMASSAMNLAIINPAKPLASYGKLIKNASNGLSSELDKELQSVMEYTLFAFKSAAKDATVEALKKQNEAINNSVKASTQNRGIESSSDLSPEVKKWLTSLKSTFPPNKQLSLQDARLWDDIADNRLASYDKQDVFIFDFTCYFINKYGKIKDNYIEIIEYAYSKDEHGYELGDRPFAIRIPIAWYYNNASKIKAGSTTDWFKLIGRMEADEFVPSSIKGVMYAAPVINIIEVADTKIVWGYLVK